MPEVFTLQFMAHLFPRARIMLFHCAAMMSRTINSSLLVLHLWATCEQNCSDNIALHVLLLRPLTISLLLDIFDYTAQSTFAMLFRVSGESS